MKRLLLTAATAVSFSGVFAQANFFEKTCYRGAFAPAPTPMWTDGWAEWDPINVNYPATNFTVSGNITSNTTWTTGQVVLLSAQVYIKNNAILTIQPGVIIRGDKNVQGAGIFVTKGSQLIANGTVNNPIVFTSNGNPGDRAAGDWGGIILMGKANTNTGGPVNIEGLPVSADTEYGVTTGADDNDNSGSLKYVRIEFAGFAYQQDKEINTLTMGAVGRGTTIDYIQASFGLDDAFEWFGGTVNAKHLVSFRCLDDDFDTDFGYSGNVQFCLAVRDPEVADNPQISTSEIFESDNNAGGSNATPKTSAIFSNVTAIGPLRGVVSATTTHAGYRRGARIRRHSELKIHNSIFMDNKTRGLHIDGTACEGNAEAGLLKFKHNILAGYGQKATETQATPTAFNATVNAWLMSNGNDTLKSSANILADPYIIATPSVYTNRDYRPAPGSIALSGASFTDAVLAASTSSVTGDVMASFPASVCIGQSGNIQTYSFVAQSTVSPGYCSLSWSASQDATLTGNSSMNPTITINTIGTHTVTLMVTNGAGTVNVPQTVTTYTCEDVAVGSIAGDLSMASLFPNPGKESTTLIVNSTQVDKLTVNVYDITGKIVATPVSKQKLNAGENKFKVDLQNFNNGIYFLSINTGKGQETLKLVVNQ